MTGEFAMTIRVIQMGLGPIGSAVARQLIERPGFEVTAAVDIDMAKVGKDLGEVCGMGTPDRLRSCLR